MKISLKNFLWTIAILLCLSLLIYSSWQIIIWQQDNKETKAQIKDLEDIKVEEIPASAADELINPPQDKTTLDDYYKYLKMPLISVDFQELQALNADTVAYLRVKGTTINYPVVQTTNNDYYLTHSFNKKVNQAGWVFLDYRNNIAQLDSNTIIYAHGRMDTTMFGSLKNIVKSEWYENPDNYVVNLSTNTQNTLWQVFSVYKIKTENYYLNTNFASLDAYQQFLDNLKARSIYDFNTSVDSSDKILTLTTCYNDKEKVVLHAKLIKRQIR